MKYLMDESPLTVQPSLAKTFGLEKAIILQQIHYALQMPKSGITLDDGEKYIWNTYQEWQQDYFKWMSVESVKKWFQKLESEQLIISKKPNASNWNHTKHYRLNYNVINSFIEGEILTTSKGKNRPYRRGNFDHIEGEETTPSSSQIFLTNNTTNTTTKEKVAEVVPSVPFADLPDASLNLNRFPFLQTQRLPIETLNGIADFFSQLCSYHNTKKLSQEKEWFEACRYLLDEGMSFNGLGFLLKYAREIEKKDFVTPKSLTNYLFPKYKEFREKQNNRTVPKIQTTWNEKGELIMQNLGVQA